MRYPGAPPSARAVTDGFPAWLRMQHFLNLLFMAFIIRSGIQVLADHPRLYWQRDCTPGTEWFRFQKAVPTGRVWTAKDDSVTLPGWLGIPGIRHSVGLARWWHFSFGLLWMINGIVVYALLFSTDQWQRIVPTTWEVFPNAVSTALQYLSLTFPVEESWTRYNSLQQLAYFITVFVAAPTSILTGFMQGPAISNRLGWFGRILNRQRARSIHFLAMWWFLLFILAHVTLVFITGARVNLNMMFAGVHDGSWSGFAIFVPAMALMAVTWWLASPFTLRHARVVQKIGEFLMWPFNALTEWWDPNSQLAEKDISPYFWPNGTMPKSAEFDALVAEGFKGYALRVGGLVEIAKDVLLRRAEGDAEAGADHDAFLHSGLVRRRKVGRRPDAPHPRIGASHVRGPLRRLLFTGRRQRRWALLRRAQDIQHAPRADHPRLRDERSARQRAARRAAAAALRE